MSRFPLDLPQEFEPFDGFRLGLKFEFPVDWATGVILWVVPRLFIDLLVSMRQVFIGETQQHLFGSLHIVEYVAHLPHFHLVLWLQVLQAVRIQGVLI